MNKQKWIARIVWLIYSLLRATWRVTLVEDPELTSRLKSKNIFLLAHWHGHEMCIIWLIKKYRISTLVSQSKDGEIMNHLIQLIGGHTVRGSSSNGGAQGLRQLVKSIKHSHFNTSFALDGPKGPIYEIKPGIFQVSKLCEMAPIFAAGICADRYWRFEKAWNKAILPKPFARVVICWQKSTLFLDDQTDPKDPHLAEQLKSDLARSQLSAKKLLDQLISK